MANIANRGGRERRNYGVLNEVAYWPGRPPCQPPYIPHPPGCDPTWRGSCPCRGDECECAPVYGYFAQIDSLIMNDIELQAEPCACPEELPWEGCGLWNARAIPFNRTTRISGCGLRKIRDGVRILASGVYQIQYTFYVPANTAMDTVLRLELDSMPLLGGSVPVTKMGTSDTQCVSACVIVRVEGPATLRLVSDNLLNVTANLIATLAIHKIADD